MRRYWILSLGLLLGFLALFGIAEALQIDLLVDPSPQLGHGGIVAAGVSFGLLVGDVFLPVPSSLLMVANGALFGLVAGAGLSLAGSLGATLLGFFIGRRSGRLIEKLVTPAEKARADRLLARWGALAVLLTRPLPLLSETVAILAGASPMGWGRLALASLLGAAPWCAVYAWTGERSRGLHAGIAAAAAPSAAVFAFVILLAGALYWIGHRSE
ncbi:MAG TPA: VTT domain-containing protein [Polyangia bacterium]